MGSWFENRHTYDLSEKPHARGNPLGHICNPDGVGGVDERGCQGALGLLARRVGPHGSLQGKWLDLAIFGGWWPPLQGGGVSAGADCSRPGRATAAWGS